MQPTAKSVLVSLADQANDEGLCWPSVQSICRRTCLTERTVQEAMTWLEESKAVVRIYRSGHSTHYHLSPKSFTPALRAPRATRTPRHMRPSPARSAPPPPRDAHPTPALRAPRTVIEPSVEPSSEPSVPALAQKPPAPTAETWAAYSKAFAARYRTEPVRNATVNGQLAQFVKRIGADESPAVAAFYVAHNGQFYVTKGHSVGMLVSDAEKLRMEWATGRTVTTTQARQQDQTAARGNIANQLIEEYRSGAWKP